MSRHIVLIQMMVDGFEVESVAQNTSLEVIDSLLGELNVLIVSDKFPLFRVK
jgi:hypothetical protein